MRIRGLHVDGFGALRDLRIEDVAAGCVVVHGPNEAGKSTLLAYLRGVLFGYPTLRHRGPHYPPVAGGRAGGEIVVEDEHGKFRIERRPGRGGPFKITALSADADESALGRLLADIDPLLYRTVFAFDLDELESFERLSAAEIQEKLFSAGLAGAGRSATKVIAILEDRIGRLFRPRSSCRIRDHVGRLTDLKARVRAARRAAQEYPEIRHREAFARAAAAAAAARVDASRLSLERLELLIELWPHASARRGAAAELERLESTGTFPENAEERAARLLLDIDAGEAALNEARVETRALEKRIESLPAEPHLLAQVSRLEDLASEARLHRDRLERCGRDELATSEAQRVVDERLAELGPGATIERLRRLDLSVPRREEVRGAAQAISDAKVAVTSAQAIAADAESRVEVAVARVKRLHEAMPADAGPSQEETRSRVAALRRLRRGIERRRMDTARLAEMQRHADALEKRVDRLRSKRIERNRHLSTIVGAVIAVAAAIGARLVEVEIWRLLLVACGAAAAAAAVAIPAISSGLRRRLEMEHRAALREAEDEHAHAEDDVNDFQASLRETDRALAKDALAFRWTGLPSSTELDAADDHCREAMTRRAEFERRTDELAAAKADLAAAQRHEQDLLQNVEAARRRVAEAERRWLEWKRAADLDVDLTPSGVLDFLDRAQRAIEALAAVDESRTHLDARRRDVAAWESRARSALGAARITPQLDMTGERLLTMIQDAATSARAAVARAAEREAIDAEIRRRAPRIELLTKRLEAARAAWQSLLFSAGADDEAGFRRRLAAWKRRGELEATIQKQDEILESRLGIGDEAARVRAELERGEIDAWQRSAEAARTEVAKATQQHIDAIRTHRDAELKRIDCEQSSDIAAIELERGQISNELRTDLATLRTLLDSRRLIGDALDEYVRTRQPAVLEEASEYLGLITSKRWVRIVQEGAAHEIRVVDAQGRKLSPAELSRGTAEQVYLCMRLGLIAEFSRRGYILPVILDDVLVNFDEARARGAAKALARMAQTNQVLVFTCHDWVRDLFVKEADADVLRLDRTRGASA